MKTVFMMSLGKIATERRNKFYVPMITPLQSDGSIAFDAIGRTVEFVLSRGADGIYAMGSSAECFLLETQERKKCLAAIVEAASKRPVIAHIGHISTDIAMDLAKHAQEVGASMIASVPPFYFGFTFQEGKAYFDDLASAADIPLMIYNLPGLTRAFTTEELITLLGHPNICAMKYTDKNFYILERVKANTDKPVYAGADECFLSALAAGADGMIGTTLNFMADQYIRIDSCFAAGQNSEAMVLQSKVNDITKLLIDGSGLAVTKYIMSLYGLNIKPFVRKPFAPLRPDRMKMIESVVAQKT